MKKFILVSTACIMLGCEKPAEQPAAPRPALVMKIENTDNAQANGFVGEIKARYESSQGFRVGGKINARLVEVGASVKKGQVLARLDSTDANLAVQANQANIAAAEAELSLAQANLERQRLLKDKKFISSAALDQFETANIAAQARLQQAKAQTQVSGNQSRYATLTADRNGIVTMIRAEPGQVVEAGEVVAQIIDPSRLEVQIPVPESRIAQFKQGAQAYMRLWVNREPKYMVSIREIAPSADAITRTFLVKADILAIDEALHPGMTATLFLQQTKGVAMRIPSTAISAENNNAFVWVVDANQRVHRQPVVIESYREDGVVLKSGLETGAKIVVVGVQALVEGQEIRPIERAQ
jgi:RND family efflux transporter MFP subunit